MTSMKSSFFYFKSFKETVMCFFDTFLSFFQIKQSNWSNQVDFKTKIGNIHKLMSAAQGRRSEQEDWTGKKINHFCIFTVSHEMF